MSVLFTLQPFIDAGIVHLIPNPMEFNPDFRRELMATAEERTANWSPNAEETESGLNFGTDDFQRTISWLLDDQLRGLIRQSDPDIDPELLEAVVEQMKSNVLADPLALLQPLPDGSDGGGLQPLRCMNLELALFVAHLTATAAYTDRQLFWRQLHEQTSAATSRRRSRWEPLARSMRCDGASNCPRRMRLPPKQRQPAARHLRA